jgi:5-methyltetrahydropteroyltriglutamate--homocysteine methyltransferase
MATKARLNPPFRADHVGSLKRPPELQAARERLLGAHDASHNLGPHDNAELRALEDRCIADVVKLQESVGMRSITDGEFRRRNWWSDFIVALENVDGTYAGSTGMTFTNPTGQKIAMPTIMVTGKIRWPGSVHGYGCRHLASVVKTGTPKITMPAPQTIYYYAGRDNIDRGTYPDLRAFWDDVVAAYKAEVMALAEAGCRYIQFDEVVTACLCDERHRELCRARGDDPDELLRTYLDAMNRIIADRPKDMAITHHICRGNLEGSWLAEGGFDPVAEMLFNESDADAFFLEYDTPRAGTFEPLRFLPEGKMAVLGLVSTKTPVLEPKDQLKRRLDDAARYAPLDRLGITPQCGFSSTYRGNPVTVEDEKKKLALLVEVAGEVWGGA